MPTAFPCVLVVALGLDMMGRQVSARDAGREGDHSVGKLASQSTTKNIWNRRVTIAAKADRGKRRERRILERGMSAGFL
jgi:hypothetical protein